jgi:hypothetical protein
MLRASPEGNPNRTIARWREGATEAAETFGGERLVLDSVRALPRARLAPWVAQANRGEGVALFANVAA